jgi:hypothetical protein
MGAEAFCEFKFGTLEYGKLEYGAGTYGVMIGPLAG